MEFDESFVSSNTTLCTYMDVPLDHTKPEGKKIKLFVAKLPATGPGKKLGTLFLNPGGPGGPGSGMASEGRRKRYSPEVGPWGCCQIHSTLCMSYSHMMLRDVPSIVCALLLLFTGRPIL